MCDLEPARRFRGYQPLAAVQPQGRVLVSGSRVIESNPGVCLSGPAQSGLTIWWRGAARRSCSQAIFLRSLRPIGCITTSACEPV
jgi:hypothetical protein